MTRTLLRRLAREEGGWAMVASIVLLTCMLGTGVALAAMVETQTDVSVHDRQRETAFNLAESALNAQVFSLARDWPGKGMAAAPYPSCTPQVVSPRCPDAAQLAGQSSSPDAVGATWATRVIDNGPSLSEQYFSDAAAQGQPAYDANGDGQLWVRAEATAKGRTRRLVALVRAEEHEEELPRGALIAGRLDITNNGNKTIIDATGGGSAESGLVAVRCTPVLLELLPCAGHRVLGTGVVKTLADLTSLLQKQISPNVLTHGYTGGNAMSVDARLRLRARAVADGTYFTSCPTADKLTGAVVYIEAGTCSYTSNLQINSAAKPGTIVLGSASLYLGGTSDLYGVVYGANLQGTSGNVFQVHGNASVHGGVLVDGQGTVVAGSSKPNIDLDLNAFRSATSYGSAGVIQNTWRELR